MKSPLTSTKFTKINLSSAKKSTGILKRSSLHAVHVELPAPQNSPGGHLPTVAVGPRRTPAVDRRLEVAPQSRVGTRLWHVAAQNHASRVKTEDRRHGWPALGF